MKSGSQHTNRESKGLGKTESGIKDAIKPKLKFDKAGLGFDPSFEFTNHWWEKMYNDASEVIATNQDKDNLALETKEVLGDDEICSSKNKTEKQLHDSDYFYKVCNGRTAHKGARHGLQLKGKLQRLEEQEKTFLLKGTNHKLDKEKGSTIEDKVDLSGSEVKEDNSNQTLFNERKKKKKVSSNCETINPSETSFPDNTVEVVNKKKKKKHKKCKLQKQEQQVKTVQVKDINHKLDKQNENTVEDKVDPSGFEVKEDNSYQTLFNQRKKKRKVSLNVETINPSETSVPDNTVEVVCKKKKKKPKSELNNFI